MLTLHDIRVVAEDYIKDSLPLEHQFFGAIWDRIKHPLSGERVPFPSMTSLIWNRLFPDLSTWMPAASKPLLTPIVILTLEAVAMETGDDITIPHRKKLVEVIERCAKVFGATETRAKIMSEGLADKIIAMMHVKGGTSVSLLSAPSVALTLPFMIWESDTHGVPLPVRAGDAASVSSVFRKKDQHDIIIQGGRVQMRQSEKQCRSVAFHGIQIKLLTLLVRYKNIELTHRELYDIAWRDDENAPQVSQNGNEGKDKDVLANSLRSPLSRLRERIAAKSFSIVNVRPRGYRCEGEFTYCLIIPTADEPMTRVPRLG
ncbi:MAG: helix-turn-helix domain-containing protein [bacterium]